MENFITDIRQSAKADVTSFDTCLQEKMAALDGSKSSFFFLTLWIVKSIILIDLVWER